MKTMWLFVLLSFKCLSAPCGSLFRFVRPTTTILEVLDFGVLFCDLAKNRMSESGVRSKSVILICKLWICSWLEYFFLAFPQLCWRRRSVCTLLICSFTPCIFSWRSKNLHVPKHSSCFEWVLLVPYQSLLMNFADAFVYGGKGSCFNPTKY